MSEPVQEKRFSQTMYPYWFARVVIFEPVHEKTNNLGFRLGPTQTGLNTHRRWLEAGNFEFRR